MRQDVRSDTIEMLVSFTPKCEIPSSRFAQDLKTPVSVDVAGSSHVVGPVCIRLPPPKPKIQFRERQSPRKGTIVCVCAKSAHIHLHRRRGGRLGGSGHVGRREGLEAVKDGRRGLEIGEGPLRRLADQTAVAEVLVE